MKRILPLVLVVLLVFYSSFSHAQQCSNGRYYNKIFSPKSHSGIQFGHAVKFDSTEQDLLMDIYEPDGDNFAHRPLIVLAFGGSFTAGIRQSPDILKLCDDFTRRGYVTATIDYRLGFEDGNDSDTNQFKAVIRGVQDMRAAVRFFYKDALTSNTYRIDTNQIFIGGVSAGAFIALNYAYGKLDTFSRTVPPFVLPSLIELGGPIGNSGNPGYSDKVKGVVDLCGAIGDTVWLMPNDPILVAVHGTADDLVACYYDSVYAIDHTESMFYGGGDINNRVNDIGLNHSIYLFPGAGHVPFVLPSTPFLSPSKEYMDTTIWLIRDFLYQNVECDSALVSGIKNVPEDVVVSLFPNPSNGDINLSSGHSKNLSVDIYSTDGKWIEQKTLYATSILTIPKQELGAGMFFIRLADQTTHKYIKTLKATVY